MNFKRYNESDNSWTDSHYIKGTDTETITTLPATIYPLGQTVTLGMKGNTVQSGTPTPTSPIYPSECGDETANLLNPNGTWSPPSGQTAEVTVSGNSITITGKYYAYTSVPVTANENYTAKYSASGDRVYVVAYRAQPFTTANMITALFTTGTTINVGNTDTVWLLFYSGDGTTGTTTYSNFMLNEGSTPLDFEPYGYKIPISMGGTTNNKYLGEVQTERKIKKLVLTGQEDWTRTANKKCYYINLEKGCPADYLKSNIITIICSHYEGQTNTRSGSNEVNEGCICFFTGGGYELYIGESTITTAADFKTYLQQQYSNGTPVTVWYVLATPTTGITNEPLMKIGSYSDSLTTSIPCTAGENTLDVQTTVQPSEVTAGFSGWHAVEDAHERENGQWD